MKQFLLMIAMALVAVLSVNAATTVDGLLTQQPAGELKTYDRAGYS